MAGKTPQRNGKPSDKSRKNEDVEMTDASKSKGKKPTKDGEDEMTVVVPPSKASKQSSKAPADAEGDVSMEGDEAEIEPKIDPVTQTVMGK